MHSRNMLLNKFVHLGHLISDIGKGFLNVLLKNPCGKKQDRDGQYNDQRELRVNDQHRCKHNHQSQQIPDRIQQTI